jgi:poly(hydroxyalkanoate) depolymerase family esterase
VPSSDDRRGGGEAESIMEMIRYMRATHPISGGRIYITGVSAGGAMAADLLADYPDVFVGGAVDSGPPAQCATTVAAALGCALGTVRNSPAQWGALARAADPGYTGPYPKVAIWQGTADPVVNVANAADGMEQWTNLWGIGQIPRVRRPSPAAPPKRATTVPAALPWSRPT